MANPYQIICPNCGKAFTPDEGQAALPDNCPLCQKPLGDDYGIIYHPSTRSAAYRTVTIVILILFFFLIVFGVVALIVGR